MRPACLAGVLLAAAVGVAQPPNQLDPLPRVQNVFPAGVRAGASVEVVATGTDLEDPSGLVFSHPGLSAEYVPPPEPKDDKKKDAAKGAKKAVPVTSAAFKVTAAKDVPPGTYDVRVVGRYGVSNPRAFVVGDKPEVNETEPNDDVDKAQRVELNAVVNGTTGSPTDVDYFVFAGKPKQRVLVHCATGSIDGKGRPLVEVYAADGRTRLGENRGYSDADALADVTLPAAGDYYVRLTEFAHQAGGRDHVYRLTLTTGPWVDAVFPPAVEPGKPAEVKVFGRNLPGGKPGGTSIDGRPVDVLTVTLDPPKEVGGLSVRGRVPPPMALLDAFEYRLPGANGVPVFLTSAPVVLENEDGSDRPESAQAIPVPGEAAGRIDRRGDRDWYSFKAKKGEPLVVELFADRLGTGQDLALTLRNPAAKQDVMTADALDDDAESLHPTAFFSRSSDPAAYKFVPPADGTYLLRVAPQASVEFGPRCTYRLRVSPPVPDFRGVVMARSRELPAAGVVRPDGEAALDVFVHRTDGFAGPVRVSVEGLPKGVTARPATVGTGQKWGTLVLTGAADLADAVSAITVKLTATINGKDVTRAARPASITWGIPNQQNVPLVARLDQSLMLASRTRKTTFRLGIDPAAITLKSDGKDVKPSLPLVVRPGDKLILPVKVVWQDAEPRQQPVQLQAEPSGPNAQQSGLSANNNQPLAVPKDKTDAAFPLDIRPNAAPGVYAVVLRGTVQTKLARDPAGAKADVTLTAFAPPVLLRVLPTSLARLLAQSAGTIKVGASADVRVRVERQFDYAGPFRVTLELPKESGLSAGPATIPAGADEVKIPVTAAKDAKPGGVPNVVVKAVAEWDGQPVPHEAKVTLTVTK